MPDSEKPRTWGVWTGRELKTIQLWRSPEGGVVLRNPEGLRQIEFTAAQWEKISEHVAGEPDDKCEVCGEREGVAAWGWDASPLCSKHRDQADKRLAAAERDANA